MIVVQLADGEADKRTSRCTNILPAGAVRLRFEADVEFDEELHFVWVVLSPPAYNKDVHMGWRFAGCEVQTGDMQERLQVKASKRA